MCQDRESVFDRLKAPTHLFFGPTETPTLPHLSEAREAYSILEMETCAHHTTYAVKGWDTQTAKLCLSLLEAGQHTRFAMCHLALYHLSLRAPRLVPAQN